MELLITHYSILLSVPVLYPNTSFSYSPDQEIFNVYGTKLLKNLVDERYSEEVQPI